MRSLFWMLAGCLAASSPVLTAAQPIGALPETPVAPVEILPVEFAQGELTGPGGERLRAALPDAQFIALGEDHGLAGPPQLAAALARAAEAVPGAAPLFHAVEVGLLSTRWTQDILASGGVAALDQALEGRALMMPFVSNVKDAGLRARLQAAAKSDVAAIAGNRFNELWLFTTTAAEFAGLRQPACQRACRDPIRTAASSDRQAAQIARFAA